VTSLSALQFAGFQRAARRRSRGQVTIPDVRLSLAEATALWTDIRAAFGPATGRDLAPQELGHLRRRAWRRSSGFASLSALSMSLEAAHAFWRLAGKLGALAARRKASPRSKVAGAAVLGLAATQMAACTTFLGSNIKGSFSCNAPGGTCAPSTVIDDQALSVIQNARPMSPAGPYFQPSARRPALSRSPRTCRTRTLGGRQRRPRPPRAPGPESCVPRLCRWCGQPARTAHCPYRRRPGRLDAVVLGRAQCG
jgi:conjugal transfer pilus assembly protein TraV